VSPRGRPVDPAEALVRRTRIRLAAVTLLMVTALVVVVGVTTAITAITLMRESVDRALLLAVGDPLVLDQLFEGDGDGEIATPSQAVLGEADTFVILASGSGDLLGVSGPLVEGLPDATAMAAAAETRDLRDVRLGDAEIRLLTMRVASQPGDGEDDATGEGGTRFLQAGMNLALQHRLQQQLLAAIAVIGALGILGALVVTLFVTQRALAPIREAFATERRFVAAASHELQTPVSVIRASAEILQRERLVGGDGVAFVEDILGETDRLGRLVADLLSLASAEAGALPLNPLRIDLGSWFVDLGRRAGAIAASRGVRLALTPPGVVPGLVVVADPDRLDQLVLILVDNAVKHSPAGGVVHLALIDQRRSGLALVQVADQGPGIPAAELERIFEPFVRVSGTRRSSGGAGLGLAIARQLAVRQGAQLSVASQPGQGATFSLALRLGV
jgi:signal transduction histidine kinase